jgi:ATP-dependent Clp protease adaptor protein ClpS
MSTETETTVDVKIKAREDIPEPVNYNVIYINDEVTTQEFVSETLVVIFHYTKMAADDMTMKVHQEGSAVVATLPFEMAEQKGIEVTMLARNNGFPLQVKLEPEA